MTYSIIARDLDNGELGVAVQSHWFSVGAIVPWARPGVGAVATQANFDLSFGPRALDLLEQGLDPQATVDRLLGADPGSAGRQLAVIDAAGQVAAFTGDSCLPDAGHITGDGVSCQANIMASDRVWPAMLDAYLVTEGSLTMRLLAALDAAEAEGGDLRGRQSAAILVVAAEGHHWDAVVSLRVEDHPHPLVELRRLVEMHGAYVLAGEADELVNEGHYDDASRLYRRASELAPDNHELRLWAALGAAQLGDMDDAVRDAEVAIAAHPGWGTLVDRLSPDITPGVEQLRARLNPDRSARPG